MEDKQKVGVITEVGDLGLGFNELSEKDQKVVKEQQSSRNTKQIEGVNMHLQFYLPRRQKK